MVLAAKYMNFSLFKYYFIVLFSLLNCNLVFAIPRDEKAALEIAKSFNGLREKTLLNRGAAVPLQRQQAKVGSIELSKKNNAYYIYNIGDNQGFVIISGDDATKPILGYTDSGRFNEAKAPDNFRAILKAYESSIYSIQSTKQKTQTASIEANLISSIASANTVVSPLLDSIKWGQENPFNLLCPYDSRTQRNSVTGCVATTMAQLMKYYEWPITGTGTHGYTENDFGYLSANFGNTNYNWASMRGQYGSNKNAVEDSAVAQLLFHCGVAVNMDYSGNSSGAYSKDAARALISYFGYDNNIQCVTRDYYSNTEWIQILKNELLASRPVMYSARSEEFGHAFVCDGYDSNDFFHINWGWDGYCNGYFELGALAWEEPGTRGATGGFALDQSMLIGIQKPDNVNKLSYELYTYSNLTASTSAVSNYKNNSINITYTIVNQGINQFSGKVGIGYKKLGENTLYVLRELNSSVNLNSEYLTPISNTLTLNALSNTGVYELFPIYKPTDSTSWSIMRGSATYQNKLIVNRVGNSATITAPDKNINLILTEQMLLPTHLYADQSVNFSVALANAGSEFASYVGLYLVSTTDTAQHQFLAKNVITIPSETSATYHFSGHTNLPVGQYNLIVVMDSTNTFSTSNWKAINPIQFNPIPIDIQSYTNIYSTNSSVNPFVLVQNGFAHVVSSIIPKKLTLYGLNGLIIKNMNLSEKLFIGDVPSGIYLLKVETDDSIHTIRIRK